MLFHNFSDVIPLLYCHQLTILASISGIYLFIVQGNNYSIQSMDSHTLVLIMMFTGFLYVLFKQRLCLSV